MDTTFKAHVTDKATGERFDFDSSTVAQYDQEALFKDYTAKAKALGFKTGVISHAKNPAGGNWGRAPKFTAPAFSPVERKWLGREVSFKRGYRVHRADSNLHDGFTSAPPAGSKGHVVGLSGNVRGALSVYVPGSGFWAVHEENLLMGVNA